MSSMRGLPHMQRTVQNNTIDTPVSRSHNQENMRSMTAISAQNSYDENSAYVDEYYNASDTEEDYNSEDFDQIEFESPERVHESDTRTPSPEAYYDGSNKYHEQNDENMKELYVYTGHSDEGEPEMLDEVSDSETHDGQLEHNDTVQKNVLPHVVLKMKFDEHEDTFTQFGEEKATTVTSQQYAGDDLNEVDLDDEYENSDDINDGLTEKGVEEDHPETLEKHCCSAFSCRRITSQFFIALLSIFQGIIIITPLLLMNLSILLTLICRYAFKHLDHIFYTIRVSPRIGPNVRILSALFAFPFYILFAAYSLIAACLASIFLAITHPFLTNWTEVPEHWHRYNKAAAFMSAISLTFKHQLELWEGLWEFGTSRIFQKLKELRTPFRDESTQPTEIHFLDLVIGLILGLVLAGIGATVLLILFVLKIPLLLGRMYVELWNKSEYYGFSKKNMKRNVCLPFGFFILNLILPIGVPIIVLVGFFYGVWSGIVTGWCICSGNRSLRKPANYFSPPFSLFSNKLTVAHVETNKFITGINLDSSQIDSFHTRAGLFDARLDLLYLCAAILMGLLGMLITTLAMTLYWIKMLPAFMFRNIFKYFTDFRRFRRPSLQAPIWVVGIFFLIPVCFVLWILAILYSSVSGIKAGFILYTTHDIQASLEELGAVMLRIDQKAVEYIKATDDPYAASGCLRCVWAKSGHLVDTYDEEEDVADYVGRSSSQSREVAVPSQIRGMNRSNVEQGSTDTKELQVDRTNSAASNVDENNFIQQSSIADESEDDVTRKTEWPQLNITQPVNPNRGRRKRHTAIGFHRSVSAIDQHGYDPGQQHLQHLRAVRSMRSGIDTILEPSSGSEPASSVHDMENRHVDDEIQQTRSGEPVRDLTNVTTHGQGHDNDQPESQIPQVEQVDSISCLCVRGSSVSAKSSTTTVNTATTSSTSTIVTAVNTSATTSSATLSPSTVSVVETTTDVTQTTPSALPVNTTNTSSMVTRTSSEEVTTMSNATSRQWIVKDRAAVRVPPHLRRFDVDTVTTETDGLQPEDIAQPHIQTQPNESAQNNEASGVSSPLNSTTDAIAENEELETDASSSDDHFEGSGNDENEDAVKTTEQRLSGMSTKPENIETESNIQHLTHSEDEEYKDTENESLNEEMFDDDDDDVSENGIDQLARDEQNEDNKNDRSVNALLAARRALEQASAASK